MSIKKRVAVLPWPGKENCFVCVSARVQRRRNFGEKWCSGHNEFEDPGCSRPEVIEPRLTFCYVGENQMAEWDGHHGPITIIDRMNQGEDGASEHYIFDYASCYGNWSQIAVEDNNLYEAFNTGDYDHIFNVLKKFVTKEY
jgi:hypothetical protein